MDASSCNPGFALAAPMGRGANLGLASFAVAASPRTFEATIESALSFDQIDSLPTKNAEPFLQSKPARRFPRNRLVPELMVAMITVEHPPMRLLLNGFARFEYEIAYYLSI